MKNKMKNKLVIDANGMIRKTTEVLAVENAIPAEKALSMVAHRGHARAVMNKLHEMVPIIEGIVVRAAKGKDGEPYLYGEKFYTKGTNSPNARALMDFAGDFDNKEQVSLKLHHWDENKKELIEEYTVKCNDSEAEKLYVTSKTHTLVIYAQLEKDLKWIYEGCSEKEIREKKHMFIDQVETMGLRVTDKNRIYLANKIVNGTHLTVLNWTPSSSRNETQLLTPLRQDTAFKIMDKVSGGVLSEAFNGMLKVYDIKKLSARIGILSAPAIEMVKAANDEFGYVIVLDEILGPQDYDMETRKMLESNGIIIDNNTSDGAYCISVEMIQKSFALAGRHLSLEKALLFAAQTRADKYFTKVFGEAKTQKNMQFRLNKLIEKYGEDKVLFVKAGEDVSHLNKEDYKVVVVGNRDMLGCIIDYNGGKLLKNISLQTIVNGDVTTYLLDIAKCSDTATSGQMLAKFLLADEEATINALLQCMADNFDEEFENMLYGDVDAHSVSLAQFIVRYCDDKIKNTAAIEALIKERIKNFKSMVYKSKVGVKAYFQRALFDDTFFLTGGKIDSLLARNKFTGRLECYSRDVEVKFAEEIAEIENSDATREEKDAKIAELLTGVAFKYPSASSNENAMLTYVTTPQLKARINAYYKAGKLTREERAILLDDFLNTSYGVTKLGADNTLKHKLAGMDTDYDGIAVVFEKKLVDILLTKNKDNDGVATIICK